jgi:hypothetical protein
MGYGYRSMKADELKGFTMEASFDDVHCNLTLYSGDKWHFSKFKITFKEMGEWHLSGKYPGAIGWLRSEFVRQVLELPKEADSMPHSGPREWMKQEDVGRYKPNPLYIFLSKWAISAMEV